jgi:MFS family permease
VLLLAAVMDLVDVSIVNIALPTIRDDLDASGAAVEWTIAGYTLAFALGLITGGRLDDVYGRRRMFLLGVRAMGRAAASWTPMPGSDRGQASRSCPPGRVSRTVPAARAIEVGQRA